MDMLRDDISQALKTAMKAKDQHVTSTLRLILAAVKDRDIAARGDGNADGISDDEIMKVMQTMIKQRNDSIGMYEKGNRPELAKKEAEEIEIIRGFLPEQMTDDAVEAAVVSVIEALGATSLKDMGRTMGQLRENFAERMDFGKASALLKQRLGGG
jgi:uncharacterized protein YqeY